MAGSVARGRGVGRAPNAGPVGRVESGHVPTPGDPRTVPPTDAQPVAAAASGRRGSWLSWPMKATLTTLLILLLLGPAAAPWWLANPARLSRIVANAVPELEADVTFDTVRLGWLAPVVLEGVRLSPRDGSRPPLTIDRIEGSHGLLAMLFSAGDLGRLRIDGLAVDLVFDEEHRTNLEKLVRAGGDEPDAPVRRPRRSAVRLRLAVDKAVVRITAPWTIEPWVSEPISLQAALAPVPAGHSEWTIEPANLIRDARMDPPVAWGVLAYVAPVLADATRTSGRFSLVLDGAKLPVGDPAAGTLSGTLAMHEVVVGPGPLVRNLFASLPGDLPPPPAVRVADESHVRFRLADRRVWHEGLEFGLPLPGPGRRLDVRSSGSVALDDKSLDLKLVLPIPADLRQDRPLLAALAGKTISLGVAGKLGQPQVVFDGSIRRMAGEVARDLIGQARGNGPAAAPPEAPARPGGGAGEVPAGEASTGEAVAEIVGDVIDEIARRRAARKAAEEAGEIPPRRGRLRDRLLGPASPPGGE